jgi:hypothetical protein
MRGGTAQIGKPRSQYDHVLQRRRRWWAHCVSTKWGPCKARGGKVRPYLARAVGIVRDVRLSHREWESSALFFSYMDPVTKLMDTGFSQHSGCPVFKGRKDIVTQWIRYGVDEEHPWDSFRV